MLYKFCTPPDVENLEIKSLTDNCAVIIQSMPKPWRGPYCVILVDCDGEGIIGPRRFYQSLEDAKAYVHANFK
jgi:hypothetical protein